ncbi:MAG: hypothetical protein ACREON_02135 [Gemmatimonadaceae bacterium]
MQRNILSAATAAAIVLGLAACGDSSAPRSLVSEEQESDDVAAAVADATSDDVNIFFSGEVTLPTLGTSVQADLAGDGRFWRFAERCPFDAGSGRFVCPVVNRGPLTVTRSFALADANGGAQSTFDPQLTASANFAALITGHIEREHWTADVERRRDVTVSGLAGRETSREWDGQGSSSLSAEFDNGEVSRTVEAEGSVVVADVVVQLPRSDFPWPISGTLTHSISAERTREGTAEVSRSFSRTATVTFNGTQFVDLQVGTKLFTLDLATGEVTAK